MKAAARITSSSLPDQGTLQAKEKWGEFAKWGGGLPFEDCHHLDCCFLLAFCNSTCKCGRRQICRGKTKKCWNVAGCVRQCAADKQTQQPQPEQGVLFLCLASFRLEPISHSALTVLTLREARKSRRPYLIHVMVVSGHIWSCLVVSGSIWFLVDLILELAFLF